MNILLQYLGKMFYILLADTFSKSNSNFFDFQHSMIYDERFRDLWEDCLLT
jgi:hypothetical protein